MLMLHMKPVMKKQLLYPLMESVSPWKEISSPWLSERKTSAQQSVHRTAGGLRVLSWIQARNLVPFRELVFPAAGNAGRWALALEFCQVHRESYGNE